MLYLFYLCYLLFPAGTCTRIATHHTHTCTHTAKALLCAAACPLAPAPLTPCTRVNSSRATRSKATRSRATRSRATTSKARRRVRTLQRVHVLSLSPSPTPGRSPLCGRLSAAGLPATGLPAAGLPAARLPAARLSTAAGLLWAGAISAAAAGASAIFTVQVACTCAKRPSC